MTEELLTYTEVAELLKVSERTIERWVAESRIPYVRLPKRGSWTSVRFLKSQLIKWLEKQSVKAVRSPGRVLPPARERR